jgi:hypothetical protein
MISGTFKAGVQTLKPGDLVRERSLATGFVGDYVVLNAKIFPTTGNTVYNLYTIYGNEYPTNCHFTVKPGETLTITEDELYEGKSVQWEIR